MIKLICGSTRIGTTIYSAGELLSLSPEGEERFVARGIAEYVSATVMDSDSEPELEAAPPAPVALAPETVSSSSFPSLDKPLSDMTKRELEALAKVVHVDDSIIKRCRNKSELIDAIEEKEEKSGSRAKKTPIPPSPVVAE